MGKYVYIDKDSNKGRFGIGVEVFTYLAEQAMSRVPGLIKEPVESKHRHRLQLNSEAALAAEFPGYSKSRPDMYEQTKDKLQTAVANAKRQEQRCKEAGNKLHTSAFQPSTEVYRIMEAIQEIESSK